MQDGRLARLEGEAEVPAKVDQLIVDRTEHTVIVEARLADRHDARIGRPADDRAPARIVDLVGIVWVDADRGIKPAEPFDAGQSSLR